jgi:hypothetical protein
MSRRPVFGDLKLSRSFGDMSGFYFAPVSPAFVDSYDIVSEGLPKASAVTKDLILASIRKCSSCIRGQSRW